MNDKVASKVLKFVRKGEIVTVPDVPPGRTLLDLLREDLHCTSVKEGCGEGDCGACTVVLAEPEGKAGQGLRYRAINSCIRLAHSAHGQALWTAEDLPAENGALHPCQQAMVECHGSQCGFCTPGFVMSLFGMYQNRVLKGEAIDRATAQADLSGNLCRCTGYRPILDAAERMAILAQGPRRVQVDEAALLKQLRQIAPLEDDAYFAPETLAGLLAARAAHPEAQIVAGTTDVGLWITKQHRQFPKILDVMRAKELRAIERYPHHVAIGAAVTLQDAYAALVANRPQLARFAERFAGLPVRNSGTLGGNVANGSPIGDSMPLLIALGASVVLMSIHGSREVPIESFYTGYRSNLLAADEILAWVKVPLPAVDEKMRVYKISKRQDDDISAVCLAIHLRVQGGVITQARIGAGGVAATPARAWQTEAALQGQPWARASLEAAAQVLAQEFAPISDMRASSEYRRGVLANLLVRFWNELADESAGREPATLEALT